ncbi:MAG: hypothetical protein MUO37_01170 [Methyloceanibacter sp.]|jgi:hypothetical protein|nr:hypothetical protein [Methyloceanibacter sp.]
MRALIFLAGFALLSALPPGSSEAAKLGETCDGIAALQCDKGLWCEHPAGECQVADGAGTCQEEPIMCEAIFHPVCGCDGKSYDNDCVRKSEGVQRDHFGDCAK